MNIVDLHYQAKVAQILKAEFIFIILLPVIGQPAEFTEILKEGT